MGFAIVWRALRRLLFPRQRVRGHDRVQPYGRRRRRRRQRWIDPYRRRRPPR